MRIAVVLVHYHTPDLAARAFEAMEQDLRASGISSEWILVDNGSRPEEREKLRRLPVRVLDPGENLGYAGGANLGVRETEAEAIIVMNPDVLVLPGCAAALAAALEEGAATAGPRFFWDRERRFLLPPTEKRTRVDELWRALAERGQLWARHARRRWRRHARRFWTDRQPRVCYELSGALLAFRRRTWEELGGFDEGYRLYFEETDWLERSRRRGLEARFIPRAEAVHLYAQATVGEPSSELWFAESCRRFRKRFYGGAFTSALELLGRILPAVGPPALRSAGTLSGAAWLEISASPAGFPAAACRVEDSQASGSALDEIRGRLAPGTYFLRTVDEAGRELGFDVLCP